MRFTLHIDDISTPEAKAFLEYARTLKFVQVDEDEFSLTDEQMVAIDESRKSIRKNGGIPHEEAMNRMKEKYPNVFRS